MPTSERKPQNCSTVLSFSLSPFLSSLSLSLSLSLSFPPSLSLFRWSSIGGASERVSFSNSSPPGCTGGRRRLCWVSRPSSPLPRSLTRGGDIPFGVSLFLIVEFSLVVKREGDPSWSRRKAFNHLSPPHSCLCKSGGSSGRQVALYIHIAAYTECGPGPLVRVLRPPPSLPPLLAPSPSLLCPTFSALLPLEPGHEGIDQ